MSSIFKSKKDSKKKKVKKKSKKSKEKDAASSIVSGYSHEITPRAEETERLKRKMPRSSSSRYLGLGGSTIEELPSFNDVKEDEKKALFIGKLEQCCILFDFTVDTDPIGKEIKREMLQELIDFVREQTEPASDKVLKYFVKMIDCNLFRALPPSFSANGVEYDPEEDDPTLEVAWPHVQKIYEFLLRFVESPMCDPNMAKVYINQHFINSLLELFDTEDPRERDYLKTVLHRIYGKFLVHRSYIRRSINTVFHTYIYETERHNGIAELLEILGSIINGFALPLKPEHIQFLEKSLIPLHKTKRITVYHQQLTYCVTQFLEKDPRLAHSIINGLVRYWPKTNSGKELLFIAEMEEILEMLDLAEFTEVQEIAFKKVAQCMANPHFQVAERSLLLWNNEYIVAKIIENRAQILPLVYGSLYSNSKNHWSTAIHSLTFNVAKFFMELDPQLFDQCTADYKEELSMVKQAEKERHANWETLLGTAHKIAEEEHVQAYLEIEDELIALEDHQ